MTNKKVFVHLDSGGMYLGNGGLNMMINLAQAVAELGYETHVFNQNDSIDLKDLNWLCWDHLKFGISTMETVMEQSDDEFVIVTSWLQGLLFSHVNTKYKISLLNQFDFNKKINAKNIRYWDQSELLRSNGQAEKVRKYCLKNNIKVAINNGNLKKYYSTLGFENVLVLENWIRSDLFMFTDEKVVNSIGHQPDKHNYEVFDLLTSSFNADTVFLCEGNQKEVAEIMRLSDFYVFYNYPSPSIHLFKGEVCGLSLLEAMACGCVCIAIEHEGNKHLGDTVVLIHDISEIVPALKYYMNDSQKKEDLRSISIAAAENMFRLNYERKQNIIQLLD